MQDDRLEGNHIIVTGGAQGIGRGIATRIARAGTDVSVFDTKVDTAAETAERIRDHGRETTVVKVDVSDEDSVKAGVETAVDQLGPIDGLVNNAGVQRSVPLLEASLADFEFHLEVNLKGTFLCTQIVARHMVENGNGGAILNIASTAAERPFAGQGPYAASKAGVVALTVVLAKELSEHGITVNAINPGTVDTPMVQTWLDENAEQTGMSRNELLGEALSVHTLDRMGQPEEIGHVATLLLSEEGDWITGEAINVDGGYTSE